MGLRAMVSPNKGQAAHFPYLATQGSLCNLTVDEIQSHIANLGKPLNSMSLDELLRSLIAAEENQVVQNQEIGNLSASSSSSATIYPENLNLSQTLSRKTFDEVWKEIVQGQGNVGGERSLQRQPTLGETKLEDFLLPAGAINIGNQDGVVNPQPLAMVEASQQSDWLQIQMTAIQQPAILGSSMPVSVFGNSVVDAGYSEKKLALSMPMPEGVATSSELQAVVERKRRYSNEMMEKTFERRQKRMIKNRESAARSRARKQAHTNQLEHEVSQLRKANERLLKKKEMPMHVALNCIPVPKYQLRRTSSAPF